MKELEEYYNQFTPEEVEKAKEIAKRLFPTEIFDKEYTDAQIVTMACLEMAKWKNEQFSNTINGLPQIIKDLLVDLTI